jgi:hypothetical protein
MEILYSYDKIDSILVHNMRNYSYYVKHGLNYNAIEKSLARFYDCPKIPCSYEYDKLEILKIKCHQCKNNTSFVINDKSIVEGENIMISNLENVSCCNIVSQEEGAIILKDLSLKNYISNSECSHKIKLCYFLCPTCRTPHLLAYNTKENEIHSNCYVYKREIIGLYIIDSFLQQIIKDVHYNESLKILCQDIKQKNNYLLGHIYPTMQDASKLGCNKSLLYCVDWDKTNFHIWHVSENNATVVDVKNKFIYYRIEDKLFLTPHITNKAKRFCITPNSNITEIYNDVYTSDICERSYCVEMSSNISHINHIEDYFKTIQFKRKVVIEYKKRYLLSKYSCIAIYKNLKYIVGMYLKHGFNPKNVYLSK